MPPPPSQSRAAARSQDARHAAPPSLPRAAPAPLGLRFRALLGLGFVPPPEPRPCAHCASIAYALLPAARVPLYRHRADPESSSRSLPSGSPARIAPIVPAVRRHPRHPPPSLSSRCGGPGPWLARTAPYASLFRRMREKGPLPGNIRPKCMLFEIKMATSSPHASVSGRNRAIQDAWRANLAAKGPFPRRGARNHAWREDVASAARPFRGSGMRSGRTGLAPCGAGLACLPHAPPLSSRLCPPRPAVRPNGLCALLSRFAVRDPPRGPRTDASRHLRAAPIPPAARTHRVQETSGTTQATQCGHKNRIPKWGPY